MKYCHCNCDCENSIVVLYLILATISSKWSQINLDLVQQDDRELSRGRRSDTKPFRGVALTRSLTGQVSMDLHVRSRDCISRSLVSGDSASGVKSCGSTTGAKPSISRPGMDKHLAALRQMSELRKDGTNLSGPIFLLSFLTSQSWLLQSSHPRICRMRVTNFPFF